MMVPFDIQRPVFMACFCSLRFFLLVKICRWQTIRNKKTTPRQVYRNKKKDRCLAAVSVRNSILLPVTDVDASKTRTARFKGSQNENTIRFRTKEIHKNRSGASKKKLCPLRFRSTAMGKGERKLPYPQIIREAYRVQILVIYCGQLFAFMLSHDLFSLNPE